MVGSIEELGVWKDYRYELKWTEGHIWCSTEPLIVTNPNFQYKYVLLEDQEMI